MNSIFNEKPHRRYNALTGEWILVSPHRTKRPWQGKMESLVVDQRPDYDPKCYLCPGNERASGDKNPKYKATYSFVNDFAPIFMSGSDSQFSDGLLHAKTEQGICKVICFSPDHSLTLPLMNRADIEKVIELWQQEYTGLGAIDTVNHIQIFENKGAVMGCSNPHPHGQIWAQYTIPEESRKKGVQMANYFEENQESLLKAYLRQELAIGERIVLENNDFVALVPFWAIWPYETMIAPKKHYQHIAQLNSDEVRSFADILKRLTIKYDNLFEISFPYSAGIHQSPTNAKSNREWHFHMPFYPPLLRSATVKKFMVGYEMLANPQRDITAEQAAAILRNLPEVHYTVKK